MRLPTLQFGTFCLALSISTLSTIVSADSTESSSSSSGGGGGSEVGGGGGGAEQRGGEAGGAALNVFVPCSGGQNVAPHAIVPDQNCQEIPTGAFSVYLASQAEQNVQVGFSAEPDCRNVFIPTFKRLSELQRSKTCVNFKLQSQDGEPKDMKYVVLVTKSNVDV